MMSHIQHNDGIALLQHAEQEQSDCTREDQIRTLPAPIQRYLAYAQVVDKEPIRTVHLKQKGDMRQQPGQKWIPLVAEQYFTTTPHAFLWHGSMRPFPFFWMTGTDRFSGGHGTMRIKLLSVIPIPLARGPKMDQGELQRYLGEIIWFPTAWLSNDIAWQAIDDHSAQATLHEPGITGSVVLHVNEQGHPHQEFQCRSRGRNRKSGRICFVRVREEIASSAAPPAFCQQEAGPGRIGFQLAPQAIDCHLEQVMLARIRIPPDALEQQLLRDHPPCILR